MPKITATAHTATVIAIRPEAQYVLGRDGNAVHALVQIPSGYVTACPARKSVKPDARRTSNTRADITCTKCKAAVNGMLEATA